MNANKTSHIQLINAVTSYDRKQSTKTGYNRYALGMYLQAVQSVDSDIATGSTLRHAILHNFIGKLADICLVATGQERATKEELRS